jgi:hypothetical protein
MAAEEAAEVERLLRPSTLVILVTPPPSPHAKAQKQAECAIKRAKTILKAALLSLRILCFGVINTIGVFIDLRMAF